MTKIYKNQQTTIRRNYHTKWRVSALSSNTQLCFIESKKVEASSIEKRTLFIVDDVVLDAIVRYGKLWSHVEGITSR